MTFLEVFVRHVASGIPDLVNDTLLDFGLWITGGNGLGEPVQVVRVDDEDVLDASAPEVIQHAEPELGGFVLANPHAQHILVYSPGRCR